MQYIRRHTKLRADKTGKRKQETWADEREKNWARIRVIRVHPESGVVFNPITSMAWCTVWHVIVFCESAKIFDFKVTGLGGLKVNQTGESCFLSVSLNEGTAPMTRLKFSKRPFSSHPTKCTCSYCTVQLHRYLCFEMHAVQGSYTNF